MQCPECSYISFKIEKACGACGFKFKKTQQSPSLTGKDTFTLFAGSPVKKQEKIEENTENVSVLEEKEPESFIDTESGDFKLDLPEIQEEEIEKAQVSSDSEISEYEPLEFDPNADIDLGEVEVEGLGLEPVQIAEEAKSDDAEIKEASPQIATGESEDETLNVDESLSLEPAMEIAEPEEEPTLSIDEPAMEIAEPEEEPTLSIDEPAMEIAEPEEEPTLSIDEPALEIAEPEEEPTLSIDEPALEIAEPEEEPTLSIDEPALEPPELENGVETPELDLGDSEIKLDLGYEPPPTNEPDPATLAAQLDSLDLNLTIDDSEGPLDTQSNETPEIEIEDLGLELESPDDPEKDKS